MSASEITWQASGSFRVEQIQERPYRRTENTPPPQGHATTAISYSRLELSGIPKPEASWSLRLNPASERQKDQCIENANGDLDRKSNCNQTLVQAGTVLFTPDAAGDLALEAGLMDIEVGGWEIATANQEDLFPSDYLIALMPFSRQQPAFRLYTQGSSRWGVQVTNDTTTAFGERGQFANRRTQPVPIFYWDGDFSGVKPKLQLTSFDQNKSFLVSLGILTDPTLAPFSLAINSTLDRRIFKLRDPDRPGEYRRKAGIYLSQVLDVRIDLNNRLRLLAKGSVVKLFDCHCTTGALPEMDLRKSWTIAASVSISEEMLRAFAAVGSLDGKDGRNDNLSPERNTLEALSLRVGLMGRL